MAPPRGSLVFLDIDTQRDFLEPQGSMFLEGSHVILQNLERITMFARDYEVPIVGSSSWHLPNEPAPETDPRHCIAGTRGADRIRETRWAGSLVLPADGTFQLPASGTIPAHITIQKRNFDIFTHPDIDQVVEIYARKEPVFVVYGVTTEHAVANTVRGLRERNQPVRVIKDATFPRDPASVDAIFAEFEQLGAELKTTIELCGPA